jgi:hypothetical protein
MKRSNDERETQPSAAVDGCPAPLLGSRNAEALVGQPLRWVLAQARRLGVPVLTVGSKRFVRASEFFAAIEQEQQELLSADLVDAHQLQLRELEAAGDAYGIKKEHEVWRIQLALRRELTDEERAALLAHELGLAPGATNEDVRRLRAVLARLAIANGGPLLTMLRASQAES